jgi:hypothetical protein
LSGPVFIAVGWALLFLGSTSTGVKNHLGYIVETKSTITVS